VSFFNATTEVRDPFPVKRYGRESFNFDIVVSIAGEIARNPHHGAKSAAFPLVAFQLPFPRAVIGAQQQRPRVA
jgi:hypothetical protein